MGYEELKLEVGTKLFLGPYIQPSGTTGQVVIDLEYAGFRVLATNGDISLDAEILKYSGGHWWDEHDTLLLFEEDVPPELRQEYRDPVSVAGFSFRRLLDLLEIIYCYSKSAPNPIDLLSENECLFEFRSKAPLKRNAFRYLVDDLFEKGFAITPMKRTKAHVYMRVVWVPPKCRNETPITKYATVGSLKFPLTSKSFADGHWQSINAHGIVRFLDSAIPTSLRQHPKQMLSPSGLCELEAGLVPRGRWPQKSAKTVPETAHHSP